MIIITLASILPVIILLMYIYQKDQYKREPLSSLLKAFFGGIGAALLTLLFGCIWKFIPAVSATYPVMAPLFDAFCKAAIPEECCKFLFLYLLIWRDRHFDEYYDGIEYAVFVSLGFAALENFLYVLQGGIAIAISRACFAVPAHFFFGILMGYFFSFAKFRPHRKRHYLGLSLFVAIVAHGLYDFILMYTEVLQKIAPTVAALTSILFYIFFFIIWKVAIGRVNQLQGE